MVTPAASPTGPLPARALRMGPALAPGDAVALFSPSSHSGRDGAGLLTRAAERLSAWGLRPRPVETPQPRYLAGDDRWRAREFQALYCDPDVKALFATRGGYGAARMLPHLDGARIAAAPPKAVVGMSDVVALFAWLHAEAGVGAYHGPCLAAPSSLDAPEEADNLADLHALLFEPSGTPRYDCTLLGGTDGSRAGRGGAGSVQGRLLGGNLAVLASLLGTPWALGSAGCILFLEDVNEAPFRVDRLLTQLRLAGRLAHVRAVVFGHLRGCDGDPPGLLGQVLADLFQDAPYPVAQGLLAGHGPRNRTLPLGREARLTWQDAAPGAPAVLEMC